MTQPAFTKMYLKGKQPLYGYTVNSNGTEAAVAQAQPARRPSHLKRPRTEPRLVAGRCSKVKVLIAVPQRKGNVSEGRAAPVDGSGGHHEQSPGRGAGGVGRRINFSRHGESGATTVPNPHEHQAGAKSKPRAILIF